MSILVFILVIIALILVHELGHFAAAKLSGMRVEEFGLGYPPRMAALGKIGDTLYTLNWLPFGGFVKIYGEDDNAATGQRAFGTRPRILQAFVLLAGVAMNLFFAYVLITGALVAGTPRALAPDEIARARETALAVSDVLPGSPAARAGLLSGDTIVSATDAEGEWHAADPESFADFVAKSGGEAVTLSVEREAHVRSVSVVPSAGVVENDPSRYALGVAVATIGVAPLSLPASLIEGARLTWGATVLTAGALWHFFYGVFTGHANFSQVAGPVGIAGVVGGAAGQGIGDLLSIMAIISINLALINFVPIPALDGGRFFVVLIEAVLRRPLPATALRAANTASFAFLVLLMIAVTVHDIYRIAA